MKRERVVAGVGVLVVALLVSALLVNHRSVRYWLIALAIALVAVLLVWLVPSMQALRWSGELQEEKRIELRDKARGTMVQLLGAVGLVATAAITVYQVSITRDTAEHTLILTEGAQAAEQFGRAIDQLGATDKGGKPALEIRLGGLYALERFAYRSPADRDQVGSIVAAYVRTNSHKQVIHPADLPKIAHCVPDSTRVPVDIAAALDVLRSLYPVLLYRPQTAHPPTIDLSNAGLAGANMGSLDLRAANLTGTQVALADLENAVLDDAQLARLDGRYACFAGASAKRARFTASGQYTAAEASADKAKLQGAEFGLTDLTDAVLEDADLRHARLEYTNVTRTNFAGAAMKGATLKELKGRGSFPCGGKNDLPCKDVAPHQATPDEMYPGKRPSPTTSSQPSAG